jgi:hypothetical protein
MNDAALAPLQTTSTNPLGPTAGPAQYQIFSGMTASSVTITTGGSLSNVLSNNVFGIQIVETAAPIPEPGSALMMLGALSTLVFTLRRTRCRL